MQNVDLSNIDRTTILPGTISIRESTQPRTQYALYMGLDFESIKNFALIIQQLLPPGKLSYNAKLNDKLTKIPAQLRAPLFIVFFLLYMLFFTLILVELIPKLVAQ